MVGVKACHINWKCSNNSCPEYLNTLSIGVSYCLIYSPIASWVTWFSVESRILTWKVSVIPAVQKKTSNVYLNILVVSWKHQRQAQRKCYITALFCSWERTFCVKEIYIIKLVKNRGVTLHILSDQNQANIKRLRWIHHFQSNLMNNMDRMRIWGNEPSSVILSQTK